MLVVMKAHASAEEVRRVCDKIESLGYRAHSIPGAERTAIGITGNKGEVEPGTLDEMPGVQEVIRVTKPYKLVRDWRSLPARAPSRAVNRRSPPPSACIAPEHSSSAVEPTSRARLHIRFKDSKKKRCRSWLRCASSSV